MVISTELYLPAFWESVIAFPYHDHPNLLVPVSRPLETSPKWQLATGNAQAELTLVVWIGIGIGIEFEFVIATAMRIVVLTA